MPESKGVVIATLVGLYTVQLTGNHIYDGIAAVLIGILLTELEEELRETNEKIAEVYVESTTTRPTGDWPSIRTSG